MLTRYLPELTCIPPRIPSSRLSPVIKAPSLPLPLLDPHLYTHHGINHSAKTLHICHRLFHLPFHCVSATALFNKSVFTTYVISLRVSNPDRRSDQQHAIGYTRRCSSPSAHRISACFNQSIPGSTSAFTRCFVHCLFQSHGQTSALLRRGGGLQWVPPPGIVIFHYE